MDEKAKDIPIATLVVDSKTEDVLHENGHGHIAVVDEDLGITRRTHDYKEGERLKKKMDYHIIVPLMLIYFTKCVDQNLTSYLTTMNTGSKTNILAQLHMTTNDYAYLATTFTVGFMLAEVPSNIIVKWSTPRLHLCRILLIWSIIECCMAACTNKSSILACRFLLGLSEGGLYPGIIYMLGVWYRPDEIAARVAWFGTLTQISTMVDALVSYGVAFIPGTHISQWRIMFLITGGFGLLICVLVFFVLPDYPDSTPSFRQFLTQEEGAFMAARLPPHAPRRSDANFDWKAVRQELKNPLLYLYGFAQFFENAAITGIHFWLPTLIQGFGLTTQADSQLLNIPPAFIYAVAAVAIGVIYDHNTSIPKPLIMAVSALALGCFYVGLIFCKNPAGKYTLIMFCYVMNAIYQNGIIPMRIQTLRGSANFAFSVAFCQGLGQASSLFTAQIFQSRYKPTYAIPFTVCIVFTLLAMFTILVIWYLQRDVEADIRRVAKLRRKAGKNGEVIEDDVLL